MGRGRPFPRFFIARAAPCSGRLHFKTGAFFAQFRRAIGEWQFGGGSRAGARKDKPPVGTKKCVFPLISAAAAVSR